MFATLHPGVTLLLCKQLSDTKAISPNKNVSTAETVTVKNEQKSNWSHTPWPSEALGLTSKAVVPNSNDNKNQVLFGTGERRGGDGSGRGEAEAAQRALWGGQLGGTCCLAFLLWAPHSDSETSFRRWVGWQCMQRPWLLAYVPAGSPGALEVLLVICVVTPRKSHLWSSELDDMEAPEW